MAQTTASPGSVLTRRFGPKWLSGLQDDYRKVLVDEWSPYLGGILLVTVAACLMAGGLFWGVFGGLRLWGDYLNNAIGLGPALGIEADLESPLMHRISLMDITLILGALSAALLSSQFRINHPPPLEYVWGALGGTLMGIGATLAGGCTVGGFFTPVMFASPAGLAMLCGLVLGAALGLKGLIWTMEHITWGATAPSMKAEPMFKTRYPLFGFLVLAAVLWWGSAWLLDEDSALASRGLIVLAGFALGFILHRSRFCFSRVFREPFMTGDGTMTKAMILTLATGITIGSLLLQTGTVDPYLAIPATFWLGSLIGGVVFGVGMIFAGGCASGSLWRVGEGHLKLVVAVVFFGWSGSVFSAGLRYFGVLTPRLDLDFLDGMVEITMLGYQAYLPDLLSGWGLSYLVLFSLLGLWYGLVRYNESTERFTVR